jgi:hypothetical protein
MGGAVTRILVARTRQFPQRLIDVSRSCFPRGLTGELDARGHCSVMGDAGQAAELVQTQAKDIVEARVGLSERQRAVEGGPAAQHAGGELVGETAVALGQTGEGAVAGVPEGGPGADSVEHGQRGASRGSRSLNPASP